MAAQTRVWAGEDRVIQHTADPPAGDTAREWHGTTACGLEATLRWIHPEQVDVGRTCEDCAALVGIHPTLEGDHPGPV